MPDILKIFDPKQFFKWTFEVFEFYFLPNKFFRELFNKTDEEKVSQTGFYIVVSSIAITAIATGISDMSLPWTLWIMFKKSIWNICFMFFGFIVVYIGNRGNPRATFKNIILFTFIVLALFEPFRFYFYCEFIATENYNMYLASNICVTLEAIFINLLSCFIFYDSFKIAILKLLILWFCENLGGAVINSASTSTGDTNFIAFGPEPIYDEYINILNKMQTRHTVLIPYTYNKEECYGLYVNGELKQYPNEYKKFYQKVLLDLDWFRMAIDSAKFYRNKKALLKQVALCESIVQYFAAGRIYVKTNSLNETYFTTNEKATELFSNEYNECFEDEIAYHNIVGRATYPFFFFNYYYYIRRKLNGERAWIVPPNINVGTTDKFPDDMDEYH